MQRGAEFGNALAVRTVAWVSHDGSKTLVWVLDTVPIGMLEATSGIIAIVTAAEIVSELMQIKR